MTVGPLDIAMREGGATVRFTAGADRGSGGCCRIGQVYEVQTAGASRTATGS
jgi:hypothetical protein